ncbi:DUF805 domain-containing protein [Shewanella sp. HL-SH4]|uniref:DUF805 domain-containing protein n=1 Tax=Shewanella sp. HL-SH4 TaxID=3436240 RepID=UPI003EBD3F7A
MQLNTLWCYQGRDNAFRFLAIILASFSFLFLVGIVFPQSMIILFAALLTTTVISLSALRRLHDAGRPIFWVLLAVLPHLLFVLSCYLFWPFAAIAGVGLLGIACSVFISFFPAISQKVPYVEGYYGPKAQVKSELGGVRKRREPQVFGQAARADVKPMAAEVHHVADDERGQNEVSDIGAHHASFDHAEVEVNETEHTNSKHIDIDTTDEPLVASMRFSAIDQAPESMSAFKQSWQASHRFDVDRDALDTGSVTELIKSWLNRLKEHHIPVILGAKVLGVLLVSGLIVWLLVSLTNSGDSDEKAIAKVNVTQSGKIDRVSAKLPDGFWIVMQDSIFIVRWLGDTDTAKNLWRLDTAQGDKTCSELVFNDGSEYRPISVDLMSDEATEARFSPLDNKSIINHIAMRGSFKLCGYDFSLKGSQATLMQHQEFADYLPTD